MAIAAKPARLREIPPDRLRKLRKYTNAVAVPLLEHTKDGLLENEELVFCLLAAAMFVQTLAVQGQENPPQTAINKAVWGDGE